VPACVAASPILDALSFVKVAAFETKLEPNENAFGDHFGESEKEGNPKRENNVCIRIKSVTSQKI
jgi:hypothetical protein